MIYFILIFIGIIIGLTIMSIVSQGRYKNYQNIIDRLYKRLSDKNNKRKH